MYGIAKTNTPDMTLRIIEQLKFEKILKMTYNYYSELEPCSLKNTKGGEEYGINSNP